MGFLAWLLARIFTWSAVLPSARIARHSRTGEVSITERTLRLAFYGHLITFENYQNIALASSSGVNLHFCFLVDKCPLCFINYEPSHTFLRDSRRSERRERARKLSRERTRVFRSLCYP